MILDKKLSYYIFVKYILIVIFLLMFIIVNINLFIDPLYNWGITNYFDFRKNDFDERIQKTNYLANINKEYDAVLLGNSRSTYIDTSKFNFDVKVFNYSVNAMSIYEYDQVLENFIKLTGKQPKIIFIGIDPFDFKGEESRKLENILLESTSLEKKIKNLLSFDLLIFSLKAIVKTIQVNLDLADRKQRYYDNNLVKGNKEANLISNQKYIHVNYGMDYNIDYNLFNEYKKLKNKFKDSEFVIYCLPFHKELIESWQQDKLFDKKNKDFINNLVNIFDKIYYFNYINEYNSSYLNYYDRYHFYPYLGDIIAEKINELYFYKKSDFGYIINKENSSFFLDKR